LITNGNEFLIFVFIICAILNIALFFKVWRMTNDVKGIHKLFFAKEANERKPDSYYEEIIDKTIVNERSRS